MKQDVVFLHLLYCGPSFSLFLPVNYCSHKVLSLLSFADICVFVPPIITYKHMSLPILEILIFSILILYILLIWNKKKSILSYHFQASNCYLL